MGASLRHAREGIPGFDGRVIAGEVAGETSTGQVIHGLINHKLVQAAGVRTSFYFSHPQISRLIGSGTEDPAVAISTTEAAPLQDQLAQAKNSAEAGKVIHDALVARVAKLFQVDKSELVDGEPLYQYGVDSLSLQPTMIHGFSTSQQFCLLSKIMR